MNLIRSAVVFFKAEKPVPETCVAAIKVAAPLAAFIYVFPEIDLVVTKHLVDGYGWIPKVNLLNVPNAHSYSVQLENKKKILSKVLINS